MTSTVWPQRPSLTSSDIPNVVHFILFQHSRRDKPFTYTHYLCIRSFYVRNRPEKMYFYYNLMPKGFWWDRIKACLTLEQVNPPETIFGNPLYHLAHKADVFRLEILRERGGIYVDLDVLCLKSFTPLLQGKDVVMGREGPYGLCNAVILARPNASFLDIWYQQFVDFRSKGKDQYWSEMSVRRPLALATSHPGLITALDEKAFFWPLYSEPEVLWTASNADFSSSYCIHLWESLWSRPYLERLTPERVLKRRDRFSELAADLVDCKSPGHLVVRDWAIVLTQFRLIRRILTGLRRRLFRLVASRLSHADNA